MIYLFILIVILYLLVVYMLIRAFYILNQETDWNFKDKQVKDMYKNVKIHKGGNKYGKRNGC